MKKLKREILDQIASDPELFAKVCIRSGSKPVNLYRSLELNGNKINSYSVVMCIAEHLHREPCELLEELEYETQS